MVGPRYLEPLARALMALLFLVSGVSKLAGNAAIQAYMRAYGVPGLLSWPAAAWEITAALLLLLGWWLRPLCVLLAGWCLLTAAIFHTAFSDQNQMINFLKNMTMAGGFLLIALRNPTRSGVDGRRLPDARPAARPHAEAKS
jgi:putative oxidoreductase